MLTLDSKDKSIEIALSAAVAVNELPVICSYEDRTMYGGAGSEVETNGTTAVTIISGANQGDRPTIRTVKFLSVRNADTAPATATIQINDGTDTWEIYKVVLSPDETLFYEQGRGWYVLDRYGAPKQTQLIIDEEMIYFAVSGTDTYVGSHPKVNVYYEGLKVAIKVANNNTGASTLNINTLGAKNLLNFVGATLAADELEAGGIYEAVYDGTQFQITSVTDKIVNGV